MRKSTKRFHRSITQERFENLLHLLVFQCDPRNMGDMINFFKRRISVYFQKCYMTFQNTKIIYRSLNLLEKLSILIIVYYIFHMPLKIRILVPIKMKGMHLIM